MNIREFEDADWDAFWPIFREITAAQQTYPYDPSWTSAQAKDVWTSPDHVVVAEEDGVLLGSAGMGTNRPGPGSHVSTASFMVGPATRGRGVGRALGEYALTWARENGYASMQFNAVVETNTSAVHLWQSLGFEIIGTVPEAYRHPEHGLVGLHVMYRQL